MRNGPWNWGCFFFRLTVFRGKMWKVFEYDLFASNDQASFNELWKHMGKAVLCIAA